MPRTVALERAEIVGVAELLAQLLEDRPVVLAPLDPQLAVHEAHEIRDDAIVVEQGVVHV